MKTSEVLERALEKLGPNGEHWTQRVYHRDANGHYCGLLDASSHCAVGAMWAAVGNAGNVAKASQQLAVAVGSFSSSDWNDTRRDFSEIRAGFLKAIALAKQQEQANDN